MAYNKTIEQQIDTLIRSWPNIEKKKMFGGVCYLTRGNMCFGIWQKYLTVRTDTLPHHRRIKVMKRMIFQSALIGSGHVAVKTATGTRCIHTNINRL